MPGHRYTDGQRQAIYELKRQNRSGSQIARLCAMGVNGLDPFEISKDVANRIAREERQLHELSPLAQGEPHEALRTLVCQMIEVAEKWFQRQAGRRRSLDTMEFKRMTASLAQLRDILSELPLGEAERNGHKEDDDDFFARLAAQEDALEQLDAKR
jgi:hypothetical protein